MGNKAGDRAGWGMVGFVLAAAALLTLAAVNGGHYLSRLDNPENGQDFAAYYVPAAMLRAGQADIYTLAQPRRFGEALGIYPDRVWAQPYLYPPVVAQALVPLAWLPYAAARTLWFLASGLALLGALAAVLAVTPPGQRRWTALLWLTLPHHVVSLYTGQADTIVTALLAAGFVGLARGTWRWAGAAIALAAAIKVTPVLVGFSLLRRREGLKLAALAGSAILLMSVVGAWAQGAPWLWAAYAAELPQLAGITRDWVENVSLSGALRRLFLTTPHPFPHLLETLPFLSMANVLALAHILLAALLLGAMLAATVFRPPPSPPEGERQRLYALAVIWLLLAAPITWPSTLSLLVIPAAWLVSAVHAAPSLPRVVAASVAVGMLWLPNATLPFLSLADWSLLRTGALLALFVFTVVSPSGAQAKASWRVAEQEAA